MSCSTSQLRQFGRWGRAARWLGAFLVVSTFAVTCSAREQAEEFVAGLRERGLHELALDYLDKMRTSRLADSDFVKRIPYHRGVVLIAQARQTPDEEQRVALFDEASKELDRFVKANPESPAAAEALLELANVFVDQAKLLIAEADQIPEGPAYTDQRGKLNGEARRLLAQAAPKFRQAEQLYATALAKIPKTLDPKTQSELITQRQEYRGRLAQVSVLAAQAMFDTATTYPSGSSQFNERNQAAAKTLAELYEKYSRWLVGLYARLYEGRCYQALGDYQRALGCYEELISQSSVHPAFRKLIASAYGYQAQCLISQDKFDMAIANCTNWLKDARDDESESPEWLFVQYELAEALRLKSESPDTKQSERRGLATSARDAYRVVAAVPNEYQARARAAAAALGAGERSARDVPRDFASAYRAGKDAMASVNAAKLALPSAAKNNPAAIPELRLQMDEGQADARRNFRLALSLVDDDTELEPLNEVRYYLCWLYWESGDYWQAALLGEFLARRYPEHPAAAASAKLALASYERLQQTEGEAARQSPDPQFAARKMAEVAEFITRRWPNTQTAEMAYRVLLSYAIRADRIDEAKDLLGRVSATARPALESQLGNAMWARYLVLSQRADASRLSDVELGELRKDSIRFMQSGLDAARISGKVTEVTATSGLYLVQSEISDENYSGAIRLLEDPKVGPLSLVLDERDSAARQDYIVEAYKAALRAYVSVTPPKIDQAIDIMKRLEQAVADGDRTQPDQLMRIYVSLAKSLSDQLEQLRATGKAVEAARLSGAFGEFLDQIDNGPTSGDWATRYWIAQTNYAMGESLRAGPATTSSDAKRYFVKARDEFAKLLAEAEQDPSTMPSPSAALAAQKQLGECYRELGDYKQALNAFSAVLADQESQLSVQQAAARTYQEWGRTSGNIQRLERAIYGGYKLRSTGKNRIWGWLKLALVAERAARANPSFEDAFFEARLEAARCRYLIGTKSEGSARQQNFATAKQSIRSMLQLYPELGGEHWRGQYEALLKQIQQAAGETPAGLQEFAATGR